MKTFKILTLALFLGALAFSQVMPLNPYNPQIPVLAGNTALCPGSTGTVSMTVATSGMSTVGVTSQTGALTCTTPTATILCALFPFVNATGAPFWWDFYLVNAGTGTVTVALGTGVTNAGSAYTGTLTVAAGSVKHFIVVLTACGNPTVPGTPAAQLFSLGTSVF
jgi:hypothetical protein